MADSPRDQRTHWGLRGPVRRCDIARTWHAGRCGPDACETGERGDTSAVEFLQDGSVAKHWHRNHDGSEWTASYAHDDSGRLRTVRTTDLEGRVQSRRCEYDSEGRLLRVLAGAEDGPEHLVESYEYDAGGARTRTVHVDAAAQPPNTFYAVEGTDAFYSAPGAARVVTVYDIREQPAGMRFFDQDGRLLTSVDFIYDEAGQLIEEAQRRTLDVLPPDALARMNAAQLETLGRLLGVGDEPSRRRHRYDPLGRRIETRAASFGPLGEDVKSVAYNDHGDPIEEISEHDAQEYELNDGGQLSAIGGKRTRSRSEARFRYEYDGRGNWVKKVTESRAGSDGDFSISSIESRALAYYD